MNTVSVSSSTTRIANLIADTLREHASREPFRRLDVGAESLDGLIARWTRQDDAIGRHMARTLGLVGADA
jgi:hypothetical protein